MSEASSISTAQRKPLSLALQGGGSWGAYTWGVLDVLLASRTLSIAQMSGTSAGAINGAIVASALANGSAASARKALRSFWMTVASPAMPGPTSLWPTNYRWHEAMGSWLISTGVLSPYNANPLGINLLRDAIAAHVDIDAIRDRNAPALYVTLTNVRTGLPRIIGNDGMSIDALMASCSLPHLFQAVEIDGEAYWDGGYAGNPTLWPMIHNSFARDLVVVQLAPDEAADVPRDAASIRRRVGEIVFNSSLVAEMQAIIALRALTQNGARAHVNDLRIHRIGPPSRELYERGSSLERSPTWLELLFDEGRAAARQFIERHGADVGVRETLDIAKVFADAHKPKMRMAANEDAFEQRDASPAEART
jgi:NTE family protein